jgi:hypothetical protein
MKLTMETLDDGSVKVRLEKDGRVFNFQGYVTDSDLSASYEDVDILGHGVHDTLTMAGGPNYRFEVGMDVRNVHMTHMTPYREQMLAQLTEHLANRFQSVPQRYVMSEGEPNTHIAPPVSDIPADWKTLPEAGNA